MKLLMEQWKKYLTEIGDLSIDPYQFQLHQAFPADDQYFYTFTTDSGLQYYVGFDNDKLPGLGFPNGSFFSSPAGVIHD